MLLIAILFLFLFKIANVIKKSDLINNSFYFKKKILFII